MASNDTDIVRDLKLWEEMGEIAWGGKPTDEEEKVILKFINMGCLASGSLAECAIQNASSLLKDATEGRDFNDGTDSKKTTAQTAGLTSSGRQRWKAIVKNIEGKHGGLRISIDISKIPGAKRNFTYAVIPYSEYAHYTGDSFGIELDGEGDISGGFYHYQMSFKEMATAKVDRYRVYKSNHPRYNLI